MTSCYGLDVERDEGWVETTLDVASPLMMETYRREDGEPIGDYDWVSDYEWISEGLEPYLDGPVTIVRETWQRVRVSLKVIGEREDDEDG